MPNPILKYQPTGGVTRSVGPVITSGSGNGDEGTPILGYHPGGGSTGGIGTIGQRNGYLYYWPDIENLTGSVPQTDLEAQDISVLPSESLIIVITGVNGDETHWRRMPDPSSPVTDLGLGIIVPINYDSETRPWVLVQELTGGGDPHINAFGTIAVGGTNIVADSAPDTLTLVAGTNITLTPDAFADSITIATSGGGGSGTSMSSSVTQTIHGFVLGDVLRYTGTAYAKAQADVAANAEVVGLVTAVTDTNNFTLTTGGAVTGLSGLTAGSVYFLSTTTAGLLTTTAPVATNQVSKPLLVATSATTGYFFNWRGWIVGSAAAIGGTPPNAYGTIRVAGQTDVVAATIPDILTLAAGTNVTLTTNAATDTVTIAATGGGGSTSTTGTGFWHNTTGALDAASRAVDLSTADVTGNLDKAHLNSGTGATSSTFWRGDNTWATPAGGGNVSTSGTITTGQYPRWASATTIESVTPATVRTDLGLVIGTNVQAFDVDLTTWAGITPTTVGQSFVTLANPSAITFPKISATNVVTAESASTHLTSIGGTTVGQSFFTLANPGAITFPEISATNVVSAKTAAQLKTDLSLTSTDVGLGNVTNNAQTQAAIVPNTAPSAGQILIGNAGATAYAKNTVSGSGATISLGATGVLTISAIPESSLSITNVTTGDATTSAHGFAPKGTVGTTQFWRQDWTLATPGGTGTVTATGGALTANSVVLGAGTTDTKVVAGVITDGTSKLTLGVSTTSVGSIALNNLTSGSVTIQPATGALSTATMTIPAGSTNPVVADTGAANNFLTAISAAGVISKAQPTPTNVGLGNVTNAAQTIASVVPNTLPGAGQILVGNAGATAYAPVTMGTDATITSAGALTIANNAVTLGKMATMATDSILGRATAATGNVEVLASLPFAFTGDVTRAADSNVTVLANIPDLTPAVGSILFTNIAAPTAPAATKDKVWFDTTDQRLHEKNTAGTIGTMVVADTGAASNFLTAISAAGVISKAQPAFTNLTGSVAATQMPAFTGDVTSVAGATANTLVNIPATTTIAGVAGTRGDVLYYGASGWAKLAAGTSGNQLTTNGAGADPTWAAPGAGGSGSPGGSDTYVQFNDASGFGGDAAMTWDKTNHILTVNGSTTTPTVKVGTLELQDYGLGNAWIGENAYFDGAWKYRATGPAGLFYFFGTEGQFRFFASGTGGTGLPSGGAAAQLKITSNGSVALGGANGDATAASYANFRFLVKGASTDITMPAGTEFGWTGSTTDPSGATDTGITRNAGGIVEINNGTAGTYRDLMLRSATFDLSDSAANKIIVKPNGASPNGFIQNTAASYIRGQNLYFDGTNWRYDSTAAGVYTTLSGGTFAAYHAASGTAGTIATVSPSISGYVSGGMGISGVGDPGANNIGLPAAGILKVGGIATAGDYINSSVSSQSPVTADVYVTGSNVTVTAGGFKAKGQYRCVFDVVKSAGTGAIVLTLRVGTLGTTGDASIITFTFGAGTSVADTGCFEVLANWRTVGSGTSAVISGYCRAQHNLATTGLFNNAAAWTVIGSPSPSSGFNSSAATNMGLSFNGSTAFAGTITTVQATLAQ